MGDAFGWLVFLIPLGVGVIALKEYTTAKVCFTVSGLVLLGRYSVWAISTEKPLWVRGPITILVIGLVGLCLIESFRWVERKRSQQQDTETPHGISDSATAVVRPAPATMPAAIPPTTIIKPHPKPHPVPSEKPPTLVDLFMKDLPAIRIRDDANYIQWPDSTTLYVKRQLYWDFLGKTQFVGFYIPSSARTYDACILLADAVLRTIDDMQKKVDAHAGYGDQQTNIKDLTFSGRVFIYHEDFLSITQKAKIISVYAEKKFDVQFMGPEYLGPAVTAWHYKHDVKIK